MYSMRKNKSFISLKLTGDFIFQVVLQARTKQSPCSPSESEQLFTYYVSWWAEHFEEK